MLCSVFKLIFWWKFFEALFLFEEQKDNKLTFAVSAERAGITDWALGSEPGDDPTISVDEKSQGLSVSLFSLFFLCLGQESR